MRLEEKLKLTKQQELSQRLLFIESIRPHLPADLPTQDYPELESYR